MQLTHGSGHQGRAALSPDGQKLAFASSRDGNLDIFLLDLTSYQLTQLTTDPALDYTPTWSPDGQYIAFYSERAGNHDIYRMRPDGSEQIALTDDPADDQWPAWSPDSQQLLFVSRRDEGRRQLYVMNADGSGQTQLLQSESNDSTPAWSKNGQIAFYSDRAGNMELYLLQTLDSEPERLTHNETNDWYPTWSPDGRYLLYISGEFGQGDLYVIDMADRQISPLTEYEVDTTDPAIGLIPPLQPTPATQVETAIETFDHYHADTLQNTYTLNDAWGKNALSLSPAVQSLTRHADQGQSLALSYDIESPLPDNYVGLERSLQPAQDWSNFSRVQFWVKNDAQAKEITFQWGETQGEVWKTTLFLQPSETRRVEIPLSAPPFFWADWSPFDNGEPDPGQVDYFGFFIAAAQPGKGTIYLDSLTLVADIPPPATQPRQTAEATALSDCSTAPLPDPVFQPLWVRYGAEMGCALGYVEIIPVLAEELFEGGHLFWRSDTDEVYMVLDRQFDGTNLFAGQWLNPGMKWDGSNPDGIGLSPPAGRVEPKPGFWLALADSAEWLLRPAGLGLG